MSRHAQNTLGIVAAAAAGVAVAMAVRTASRAIARTLYSFRGRTVLITGGARGLGLALAHRFANDGARLVLVSRSRNDLAAAAAELGARGADVTVHVCDVRDRPSVASVVRDVIAAHGRLDVVVNNAGVIQITPFDHATDEDFADSLAVHFWAPLNVIREALPHLVRQRGRIINISSFGGRIAVPHLLPYCAGKFALAGLSDGLNAELARHGVRVLTVTPGLMRTGSHRNAVVRGRHRAEARWFAVGAGLPLVSMAAARAADQIVRACAAGQARLTPGFPAQAGQLASVLSPELLATAMRIATRLLPAPGDTPDAQELRRSRDIDVGWAARFMPTAAAIALNQEVAPDELWVVSERERQRLAEEFDASSASRPGTSYAAGEETP
jgi:NAD(P)-dependent dehydrogenase (short-subunit alcohol dehydrogenase family)